MTALDLLADWPVTNAAAAVVTGGGSVTTVGDVQHGFRLASVTKLLSAYAGLLAVQEGVVALDDEAGPPGSTVRHLLAHASGLAFDDEVVQAAPGTRRIYSNAGFAVLGRAVEEASGFEFADYLAEAVFRPLSMDTTALRGPAGHGAFAGVADLTRFAGELLRPRLLEAEILSAATTVQFPGLAGVLPGYGRQVPNDWGLGFEIRDGKHPHWTGTHNSPAHVRAIRGGGDVPLGRSRRGPGIDRAHRPRLRRLVQAALAGVGRCRARRCCGHCRCCGLPNWTR